MRASRGAALVSFPFGVTGSCGRRRPLRSLLRSAAAGGVAIALLGPAYAPSAAAGGVQPAWDDRPSGWVDRLQAQPGAAPQRGDDRELQRRVEQALAGEDGLGSVVVSVADGVVTLRGTLPHLNAKRRAIEAGLGVEGFRSLASQLVIPEAESDDRLGDLITALFRRYGFFTVFDDLNVAVEQGAVQLTGAVTEPHKKSDVEGLVERVPGVVQLDNLIEVLPANPLDDRLRRTIANAIYGHTLFSKYARQPNPPIHIIVRSGQVRLTGVVNSRVESEFASMLARQVDDVRRFRNELRVETAPR